MQRRDGKKGSAVLEAAFRRLARKHSWRRTGPLEPPGVLGLSGAEATGAGSAAPRSAMRALPGKSRCTDSIERNTGTRGPSWLEVRAPCRQAVFTLEPPRRPFRPAQPDSAALARRLADDFVAKLDELCYVWETIRELEALAPAGECSLRQRAAELTLVAAGGPVELPIDGLLRAAHSFLVRHGMDERYIGLLYDWYCRGGWDRARPAAPAECAAAI